MSFVTAARTALQGFHQNYSSLLTTLEELEPLKQIWHEFSLTCTEKSNRDAFCQTALQEWHSAHISQEVGSELHQLLRQVAQSLPQTETSFHSLPPVERVTASCQKELLAIAAAVEKVVKDLRDSLSQAENILAPILQRTYPEEQSAHFNLATPPRKKQQSSPAPSCNLLCSPEEHKPANAPLKVSELRALLTELQEINTSLNPATKCER